MVGLTRPAHFLDIDGRVGGGPERNRRLLLARATAHTCVLEGMLRGCGGDVAVTWQGGEKESWPAI